MLFVVHILISICDGSMLSLLWAMYGECADYSEHTTGNRATGLIFSSSSMSKKFGWALGSAITGWRLGYYGFRANEIQSPETIHGIKMFLSWFPAIGTVLSVIFISMYPLSEKKMEDVVKKLDAKRD